jgi:hypothetical protein
VYLAYSSGATSWGQYGFGSTWDNNDNDKLINGDGSYSIQGDGSWTKVGTLSSYTATGPGTYTVTATWEDDCVAPSAPSPDCGSKDDTITKTTTVKLYRIGSIKSVQFTSDHGILRDEATSWVNTGSVYSEPEWVASTTNTPISQTKGTVLSAAVKLKIEPSGLAFSLTGDGPDNYVDFTGSGSSTGSDQEVNVTANAALPDLVSTLSKSVSWTVTLTDPNPDVTSGIGSSGAHTIYTRRR